MTNVIGQNTLRLILHQFHWSHFGQTARFYYLKELLLADRERKDFPYVTWFENGDGFQTTALATVR